MEKVSNISERLRQIMNEKHITQSELVRICQPLCKVYGGKINQSSISQYLSGYSTPDSSKLFLLSRALEVSELWLRGYDASPEIDMKNEDIKNKFIEWISSEASEKDIQDVLVAISNRLE